MKKKYQIRDGRSGWINASKASETGKGWLHYELREGGSLTIGLAKPGKWREKPPKDKK